MLKITLDPGHVQGANVGVCNGYREGTVMFYYAEALKKELEEYEGVEVFVTRRSLADNPSLDARGKLAVKSGSDVFLSLHSDASGNGNTRGVTVIRSLKRPDSAALGQLLANAVDGVLGCGKSPYAGNDGGVWTRAYPGYANLDYYGVIRSTVTGANVKYAYLIEHSFHTNPADCAQLDGAAVRQRLAEAEAAAIAGYFGLAKKGAHVFVSASKPDKPAQQETTGLKTRNFGPMTRGDLVRFVAETDKLGLSAQAQLQIGPMSAGDDKAMQALAASLGIEFDEVR